jgi:hypothetical protein
VFWQPDDEAEFTRRPRTKKRSILEEYRSLLRLRARD